MIRICVMTSKAGAYYSLVSRLRMAGLSFESLVPETDPTGCELILTTKGEAGAFGAKGMALEDLDEDPGVLKGQIVSRLGKGGDTLFVGVDPGVRTGLAVYYGRIPLAFKTFDSAGALCAKLGAFARRLTDSRFVVRIGDGDRQMAEELAARVKTAVPDATVEIVDEKGTSGKIPGMKGVQGDQRAASRIAFRKGEVVSSGRPRTHE